MSIRDYFIFGGLIVIVISISILAAKGVEINDITENVLISITSGFLTAFNSGGGKNAN